MEAIDIRAAGPQPEVAPNHERLGLAMVALIAGGERYRMSMAISMSPLVASESPHLG
jgi:hypothetical protein